MDPRLYTNYSSLSLDPMQRRMALYQRQPWLFSDDQVDEFEEYSKANNLEFHRQIDESGSGLLGVANQLTSGIVEGFTTLGWADEPETTAESIAMRIGHLIGFAPDIIAGVVTGGATAGVSLAKIAGKTGLKAGGRKFAEGMGKAVAGQYGFQKAATKRAGDFFGREFVKGPLALRSVPMRVADWATGAGGRMMADAGWDAAKFLQQGHWGRSIIRQAGHLGIASGVSAWQEGPEGALKASMHGALAGAVFGGIGNVMQIDKMLKSGVPAMEAEARAIIETVAKGMAGSAFTGGMATMRGDDTAGQIYEYLLGFFFGAVTHPAWREAAGKHFTKASKTLEGSFQPEKVEGWDKLTKEAQAHVEKMTRDTYGKYATDKNISQASVEILKKITGKDNPTRQDYKDHYKELNRDLVNDYINPEYEKAKSEQKVEDPTVKDYKKLTNMRNTLGAKEKEALEESGGFLSMTFESGGKNKKIQDLTSSELDTIEAHLRQKLEGYQKAADDIQSGKSDKGQMEGLDFGMQHDILAIKVERQRRADAGEPVTPAEQIEIDFNKRRYHEVGKYHEQNTPVASKRFIEQSLIEIMGPHAPKVKDALVKEIVDQPGAVGAYIDGMVQFVEGKATRHTAVHEPIHWFMNQVLTKAEYDFIYNHFKKSDKSVLDPSPIGIEESMVIAAADYHLGKKTFTGRIRYLFDKFWRSVKQFLGRDLTKDQTIREYFDRIGTDYEIRSYDNLFSFIHPGSRRLKKSQESKQAQVEQLASQERPTIHDLHQELYTVPASEYNPRQETVARLALLWHNPELASLSGYDALNPTAIKSSELLSGVVKENRILLNLNYGVTDNIFKVKAEKIGFNGMEKALAKGLKNAEKDALEKFVSHIKEKYPNLKSLDKEKLNEEYIEFVEKEFPFNAIEALGYSDTNKKGVKFQNGWDQIVNKKELDKIETSDLLFSQRVMFLGDDVYGTGHQAMELGKKGSGVHGQGHGWYNYHEAKYIKDKTSISWEYQTDIHDRLVHPEKAGSSVIKVDERINIPIADKASLEKASIEMAKSLSGEYAFNNVKIAAKRRNETWMLFHLLDRPSKDNGWTMSAVNSKNFRKDRHIHKWWTSDGRKNIISDVTNTKRNLFLEDYFNIYMHEAMIDLLTPLYNKSKQRLKGVKETKEHHLVLPITEKLLKEIDLVNVSKDPVKGTKLRDYFAQFDLILGSRLQIPYTPGEALAAGIHNKPKYIISQFLERGIYNLESHINREIGKVELVTEAEFNSIMTKVLPDFLRNISRKLGDGDLAYRINRVINDVIVRNHLEKGNRDPHREKYAHRIISKKELDKDPPAIYTRIIADIRHYINGLDASIKKTGLSLNQDIEIQRDLARQAAPEYYEKPAAEVEEYYPRHYNVIGKRKGIAHRELKQQESVKDIKGRELGRLEWKLDALLKKSTVESIQKHYIELYERSHKGLIKSQESRRFEFIEAGAELLGEMAYGDLSSSVKPYLKLWNEKKTFRQKAITHTLAYSKSRGNNLHLFAGAEAHIKAEGNSAAARLYVNKGELANLPDLTYKQWLEKYGAAGGEYDYIGPGADYLYGAKVVEQLFGQGKGYHRMSKDQLKAEWLKTIESSPEHGQYFRWKILKMEGKKEADGKWSIKKMDDPQNGLFYSWETALKATEKQVLGIFADKPREGPIAKDIETVLKKLGITPKYGTIKGKKEEIKGTGIIAELPPDLEVSIPRFHTPAPEKGKGPKLTKKNKRNVYAYMDLVYERLGPEKARNQLLDEYGFESLTWISDYEARQMGDIVPAKADPQKQLALFPIDGEKTIETRLAGADRSQEVIPKFNVLDQLVDHIRPFMNKSSSEIKREIDMIAVNTAGSKEKFFEALYQYIPEKAASRPDNFELRVIRHLDAISQHNPRRMLYWNTNDGLMTQVEMHPSTEATKRYGDNADQTLRRVTKDISGVGKNNEPYEFTVQLKPLDQWPGYFSTSQWKYIQPTDALSPESWRGLTTALDKRNAYIYGGNGTTGVLNTRVYHRKTGDYRLNDLLPELLKQDPKFMKVYNYAKDLFLSNKMIGIDKNKNPEMASEYEKLFDKQMISNLLYSFDENGSWRNAFSEYPNVVGFNKRQPLEQGVEYMLSLADVSDLTNGRGKLKFGIVRDVPGEVGADTDGGIYLHPDLFDRVAERFGQDPKTGFIKAVGVVGNQEIVRNGKKVQLGKNRDKAGYFKATKEMAKLMDKHGLNIIKRESGTKTKGDRQVYNIDFKNGKYSFVGKGSRNPEFYEMGPEELKVNVGIYDSDKKVYGYMNLPKPILSLLNNQQFSPESIQAAMDNITGPAIYGSAASNEVMRGYIDSPKNYTEGVIDRFGKLKVGKLNLDDVSHHLILEALRIHPDKQISKDILRFIFRRHKEYAAEVPLDDSTMQFKKDAETISPSLDLLENANFEMSVWMQPDIFKYVNKAVMNYFIRRSFKPKWQHSGYARFIDNTEQFKKTYNVQEGEFYFGDARKSEKIPFPYNGHKTPITREQAFKEYKAALKQKAPKEILDGMLDHLSALFTRVPAPIASGVRWMTFKGFMKKADNGGYGMLLHERDKYFFGGADNDGDLAYFFHQMPKEIVEGYKANANELVVGGKKGGTLKNIKDEKYYPLFGINESDPLFQAMSLPSSTFMPSLRFSAARGAFMGQNNTGPMVNANQMLQALYSTIYSKGGEHIFNADGFQLRIKLRKHKDEKIAGDMLRELSVNAISNTVDAANYPNMATSKQMKENIFSKIFDVRKVSPDGEALKFKFNDLYKTEFMHYWKLNNLLFGWNFQKGRPHTVQEILEGLKDYRNSGLHFESHLSKAALEFGELNMDIDPWNFVNKRALAQELKLTNDILKEERGKRYMRLIGRDRLSVYGKNTFLTKHHTVNDFSDYIASRFVILPLGEKIEKAMNDKGYTNQQVYELIDIIADRATSLKNTSWKSRLDAREQDVPLAEVQARVDSEIIRQHGELNKMARQLGINPDLLTTYYDAYILSPLKFQKANPELQKRLKHLFKLKDEYDNSELPKDELSVAAIEKEISDINKDYNQTTRMSVGWLSTRIPKEVKKAYLDTYSKEFKKYIEVPSKDPVVSLPEPPVERSAPEPSMPEVATKIPKEVMEKSLDIDLGKITPEQSLEVDKFVRNLDQFPKFKEAINLGVPGVLGQMDLVGVPIEQLSFEHVRILNRMFDHWKRGILQKKIKEGEFGKMPMKAIYHYLFYSKIDELLTPHDMKMLDVHNTPVYKIGKAGSAGELVFQKTKVPMSTLGAIQKMAGHVYNYENKFVEFWQDELDRRFGFLSGMKEAPEIVEMAVRHITRHGDGRDYHGNDKGNARKVYEKMWKDIEPEYEALLKKGKVLSIKDDKGNTIKVDAQEVLHKVKDTIRDFYKEWHENFLNKEYNEGKVLDPKTGLLNHKWVQEEILGPMVRDVPFGKIELQGMPAIARIEYELSLIDLLDVQGVKDPVQRKLKAAQYRLDHKPPSMEAPPVGKVPYEFYWSQMGHVDTRNAKEINAKAMKEYLVLYEEAMRKGTARMATDVLEYNYKNGTITLEQAIKESMKITKQRYEKALQTSVKGDNSFGETGVEWLHFKPDNVKEMSAIRMFQTPGSAMHRGYLPLPEFRRDIGVLKDYMRQWMKSYFNNLIAIRARYAIRDFEKRGPVGKDTAVWRDFFLDATKNIMGYPSFFSQKIFGITHPQARAVKKFLAKGRDSLSNKQKNIVKDLVRQIDEDHIAKSGGPYFASMMPLTPADYRFKLEEMLKSTNRLKAYRTGYYAFSDQKAVQFLEKVSQKLFNGEIPFYKDFPKDPEVRKAVMTRMVHNFGILEGKWNLMTLLAAPKSFIGNVMGGTENIIGSAGMRHFRGAVNKSHLLNEVFKGAEFEIPGPGGQKVKIKIDSTQNLNLWLETIGVIDTYIKSEIGLDPTFKPDKNKRFAVAAGKKISALFGQGKLNDRSLKLTLREVAKDYGVTDAVVNKAAAFMRKSELINRRNAFLAHYLNAREVFLPLTDMLPWDSEALIRFGKKGLEATQFLYHSAFRTNYSNTALGKVMTRFQPFAWNSVKYRRHVYQSAKIYGFKPGSRPFERYQRQVTMDMFAMALAGIFASSIFEYTLAPPMAWMQDTAQWLFGDERDRERAFFSQWPTTAFAPLQPITPPIARYPLNVISSMVNGDLEKFSQYYAWTWFPFGRLARDMYRSIPNPAMTVDFMTGFPLHGVHRKVRKYIDEKRKEEEALEI